MKKYLIPMVILLLVLAAFEASGQGPISPFILRFLDMTDTPAAYTGEAGKYVKVNAGETALEFGTPAGAGDILADGSVPFTGEETFGAGAVFKNGATSAGYITIYEDTDDGSNYTKIQAVAQAGDITYSLPPDDGDAGEQLQTNGSGVLTWESGGIVAYQQVVTVAKAGGNYTTIQGAIDSIADATTTKRYVVRVMSGVYTEAVTCKDYVDILGAGRTNTIIAGTSGTVLTFPANKCTVSEVGINVDYGALGAASTAITSAGADSVLKDCDITVTKSGGDFVMNGITITAGSFRMSDCYFIYTTTGATVATGLTQSAVKQTGVVTNVILNNNEITISTTDTNDDLVGMETTATVTGTCLIANNVITVNPGAAAASATGIWAYGTCSGAIFNQNRLTINCNASAYGIWIDSTAGGATIDTRHNEIIVTSAGAALSAFVAAGDTWNSSLDKITAASGYTNNGTITFSSSPIDGNFTVNGVIHAGIDNDKGDIEIHDLGTVKFWDDGDDTSVTLGPVADGTTTLGVTGTINATALQEGGNAVYNSGETPGGQLGGTWASPTIDDLFIKLGGDVATAGNYDFGGADLEIPQASPAVPDADGEIEYDFTDGKLVIQHGSAHAELGGSTDVALTGLIKSFGGTIFAPDGVNDVITVKAINSIEFPHGVVITAVYLGISSDTGYVLTVQNFDDFDTINGANPTIDTVTYSADTTGEIIDSTPTYATIAAGQIIMISIPATDVDWIHFEIYYYEPAA
jgi:hypothetical protein